MVPVLKIRLPRVGFCKNMLISVLYVELDHHGAGLHSLYTTMGILKVQAVLNNKWKDIIIQKVIRISIESFKTELDFMTFGHIGTECWINYLQKFTQENEIKIVDDMKGRGLLRDKDSMLKKEFAITER